MTLSRRLNLDDVLLREDVTTGEQLPKIIISPSLLSADFAHLADALKLAEDAGAPWLHLDIMDGHFVPNLTYGPPLLGALRPLTDLVFDVHLMIENPDDTIEWYLDAGADYVTVHLETARDIKDMAERVHSRDKKFGLALKPDTPVELLADHLPYLDMVLIMSVYPGFSGQVFMVSTLTRLDELRELCAARGVSPLVQVDGGINSFTAGQVGPRGAQVLVAGNAFYKAENPAEALRDMIDAAKATNG